MQKRVPVPKPVQTRSQNLRKTTTLTTNLKKATTNRTTTRPLTRSAAIRGAPESKTKTKSSAFNFSMNSRSSSTEKSFSSVSSTPSKSPSLASTRPKGTWLNVQNAQKTVQKFKQRKSAQKQLTAGGSAPNSPKKNILNKDSNINNNNKRSNPIPIPRHRNNLKYDRSDSELSSCSNASSYMTGKFKVKARTCFLFYRVCFHSTISK